MLSNLKVLLYQGKRILSVSWARHCTDENNPPEHGSTSSRKSSMISISNNQRRIPASGFTKMRMGNIFTLHCTSTTSLLLEATRMTSLQSSVDLANDLKLRIWKLQRNSSGKKL